MNDLFRRPSFASLYTFIATLLFAAILTADESASNFKSRDSDYKPAIGKKIDPITFKDIRFLPRSLSDLVHKHDPVQKRAFVLVFSNTTCPLVQKYLPRLNELEKAYRDKGVQFVAVNVGVDESILDVATQMVKFGAEFPFVQDINGNCVKKCGVERTPECVLIDANYRLRYRGRIDNQYRLGGTAPSATKSELKDAIDDLLAGREIAVAETPVDGCLITPQAAIKPSGKYNYADHVAGLVKTHCVECHQPGTAAPFSLLTYDDAAANGEMIAETVAEGRMPPWYASPEFGKFENDRTMPKADRDVLIDWVKSGMKKGNISRLPLPQKGDISRLPLPQGEGRGEGAANSELTSNAESDSEHPHPNRLPKGEGTDDRWANRTWQLGEPDVVFDVPGTFEIPASGYVDYKYSALPQLFWSDTWIQGAEILPDNPRVVHHANLGYATIGGNIRNAKLITGYVPGGGPMKLAGGVAAKIPAGSLVGLQIHLTTTGQPETVRLRVGFKYPREKIQQELHHLDIHDKRFAIKPFAPAHIVKASRTVDNDVTLYGFFAHMHNRGRDLTWYAHPPQGKRQTLLLIPNYSFDWQLPYYAPSGQMKFPAGTRFEALAHFDNSTFNPYNPDPAKIVRFGQQTFEEMMYGYVFYTEDDERLNLEVDPKTGLAVK